MANPLSELPQDFDRNFLSEHESFVKKEELGANNISNSFPTNNPWLVENFDEFLFYCCPECNYKCRLHNEFNSHALVSHPMVSINYLLSLQWVIKEFLGFAQRYT